MGNKVNVHLPKSYDNIVYNLFELVHYHITLGRN